MQDIKEIAADIPKAMADKESFDCMVEALASMFEREVFDVAASPTVNGALLADAVVAKVGRGKAVDSKAPAEAGKKYVIIGDALTDGNDAKALVDKITGAGSVVIKAGFIREDRIFNARKALLKGIPTEAAVVIR